MDDLKTAFNAHKKKLIALLLALILGAVGINLSPEQQESLVNTIDKVVPPLAVEPAPEPSQ